MTDQYNENLNENRQDESAGIVPEDTSSEGFVQNEYTEGPAQDEVPSGEDLSGQKEKAEPAGDTGSIYSWVNPKLSRSTGQETADNPWSSRNGSNFWETKENTRPYGSSSSSESSGYIGSAGDGSKTDYSSAAAGKSHTYGQNRSTWSVPSAGTAEKKKKGKGTAKKWASLVAMAVVFGLIAGSVSYAVNLAANRIRPVQMQQINSDGSDVQNSGRISTAETGRGTGDAATGEVITENAAGGQDTASVMTVADVAAEAMPSLVTISTMSVQEMQSFFGGTRQYEVQGAGTGVIIGQNEKELLIATNNHVVQGATEVSIGFIDESVISASIKGEDADTDLAIVAVNLSDITDETMEKIRIATVGDSDALVLGEQVVAIGNSLGYGQSVTSGYISAFDRTLTLSDGYTTFTSEGLIQTDAAINSGNSGGALLNMRGELIGINEAKSSGSAGSASVDNMGFAIPMSKATPILEDLMSLVSRESYSEDEQGYLGVTCADVTSEYSQMYNMPVGVCFTSVIENGPAEAAGIIKGDVLTAINDRSISTYEELAKELTYHRSGEEIQVTVYRADNGEYLEKTFTVKLGTKDVISDYQPEGQQDEADDDSRPGQGRP